MKINSITALTIPDVKVVTIQRFADERGYFTEVYQGYQFAEQSELHELHGKSIVQINESFSKAGVSRGLHTQSNPNLDKFLRVLKGKIIDVAVDIRPDSDTFGKAVAYELSYDSNADTEQAILIPYGFAHGFIALEEAHVQYLQTGGWNKDGEVCINFADSEIDWSLCDQHLKAKISLAIQDGIRSEKDRQGISLEEWLEMQRM